MLQLTQHSDEGRLGAGEFCEGRDLRGAVQFLAIVLSLHAKFLGREADGVDGVLQARLADHVDALGAREERRHVHLSADHVQHGRRRALELARNRTRLVLEELEHLLSSRVVYPAARPVQVKSVDRGCRETEGCSCFIPTNF